MVRQMIGDTNLIHQGRNISHSLFLLFVKMDKYEIHNSPFHMYASIYV